MNGKINEKGLQQQEEKIEGEIGEIKKEYIKSVNFLDEK